MQNFNLKLLASIIYILAIYGGLLFLPAGTLKWWRAWVFLGVILICTVATMLGVMRDQPELLNERFKSPIRRGQPLADKIILSLFIATYMAVVVFIPLDCSDFTSWGGPDPSSRSWAWSLLWPAGGSSLWRSRKIPLA